MCHFGEAPESVADRIRRNDYNLREVRIDLWESDIEILDALKNNTAVYKVIIDFYPDDLPENPKAVAKLSELMKCSNSVRNLTMRLLGEGYITRRESNCSLPWRHVAAGRPSKCWPLQETMTMTSILCL